MLWLNCISFIVYQGEAAEAAKKAGGNFVGEEELIQQVLLQ